MIPNSILIVEDDRPFSKMLQLRLSRFFPQTTLEVFYTLNEVRSWLALNDSSHLDLVILDHNLPDGFGLDFLKEGWFEGLGVLVLSAEDDPKVIVQSVSAGAAFFMKKAEMSSDLLFPLLSGMIERNILHRQLERSKLHNARITAVAELVNKLKHEVNNPLGAVIGAAYLLKNRSITEEEFDELTDLVENSTNRIKEVMNELWSLVCDQDNSN